MNNKQSGGCGRLLRLLCCTWHSNNNLTQTAGGEFADVQIAMLDDNKKETTVLKNQRRDECVREHPPWGCRGSGVVCRRGSDNHQRSTKQRQHFITRKRRGCVRQKSEEKQRGATGGAIQQEVCGGKAAESQRRGVVVGSWGGSGQQVLATAASWPSQASEVGGGTRMNGGETNGKISKTKNIQRQC